jgi:putative ABC transport system permease protein
MVRWAWRLFRREWRQQLLVLALITVAVAASIVGAAIGSSTGTQASATFGSANHLVNLPGNTPDLAADIAAIRAEFGRVDVIASANLATGSSAPIEVRAQDPHGAFGGPTLKVTSGQFPSGPDEIAVTSQLATRYDLHVGQRWASAPGGPKRVVGMVENPQELTDTFALVPPGQVVHPDQMRVLFDVSRVQAATATLPAGVPRPIPRPPPASGFTHQTIVLVLAVFGLLFIGLVSAAAFSVMAQRRLRALGMVGSLGATDRHVRLVLVANGAVVGLVATVIGAAVGFIIWFAYAPHLQSSANHLIDPYALPWWLIGTCMALAVVTAIFASRWPARAAARIPIVAALAGRPAPPKPAHRWAVPGVLVLGAGLVLLALGGPTAGGAARNAPFLLLGILATVTGGLLFSPLAIAALAALAVRAPVAVRVALRDLARYRSRSGAALGAASLAVTIAAIVCLVAASRTANVLDYVGPNLATNQLVVNGPPSGPVMIRKGPGPAELTPGPTAPLTQAQAASRAGVIANAVDATSMLPLVDSGATLYRTTSPGYQNFNGTLWVATSQLLHQFGIAPDPGADIITSRPGLDAAGHLQLIANQGFKGGPPPSAHASLCRPPSCIAHPVIQETSRLPSGTAGPNVVITEQALRRLGLTVGQPDQWLIQAPRSITTTQKTTAEELASAVGMTITTRSAEPSLQSLETWSTVAGILVALGVLAMTSGLVRSEAARDLRTLAATGASSRVRRAITASTAGGLGLLAGIVGVTVGLAGMSAVYHHFLDQVFSALPVRDLLILTLGVPVVAAAGGWVFAGREPSGMAHQAIE